MVGARGMLLVLGPTLLVGCLGDTGDDIRWPDFAPLRLDLGARDHYSEERRIPFLCAEGCFEPTVAVDAHGYIVVTSRTNGLLYLSEDAARTFVQLPVPPMPLVALADRGSDNFVQRGPDGRLYFTSLPAARHAPALPLGVPVGVQVAASSDGGRSWDSNTFVRVDGSQALAALAERPALGFGSAGELYLSYTTAAGAWVHRSDDGGATFGLPVLAVSPRDRFAEPAQVGPLVADSQGRAYLPYILTVPTYVSHLMLATSDDRGATWRHTVVGPLHGSENATGRPIAAVDGADSVAVAWVTHDRWMHAAFSDDRGDNWTIPVVTSQDAPVGPWLAPLPQGFLLSWFVRTEEGHTMAVSELEPHEWRSGWYSAGLAIATGLEEPNARFPHVAVATDGRAVPVWSNATEGAAYIRIQSKAWG